LTSHKVVVVAVVAALALTTSCTKKEPAPGVSGSATPTVTASATANFQPGADGIGDAYYPKAGNGGYDVEHYALDLRYDPDTDRLTGKAVITATSTADLSRFNLDFTGLMTEKVSVNGTDANAVQTGDELVVTPSAGLGKGTQFTVEVGYGGVPKPYQEAGLGEVGFLANDDGAVAIGEPQVAASWFPVNDHPRDKATYDITIAAPDGLVALSNGTLKRKTSSAGWTTWAWSVSRPMASYLATVVIGKYRVKESTHDGLPVLTAVDADLPTRIDAQMARTPAVVDFLETKFGPYPFDAIGGIVVQDRRIRFALENQTRPIYGQGFFGQGEDGSWVIAHELAHQWFGDSVSVHDWKELWLNEGFATYGQWLWVEAQGGRTIQQEFDSNYSLGAQAWRLPPGDPGAPLFDSPDEDFAVYTRGAMTLHALRLTVGDATFYQIVQAWAAEKRDSSATTPEFIALAERISGKDLDALFRAWVYGTTRPPRP